jgi:NAD(P)-dependent dehydrogenase (short-subunit alcohol dehydrogenase family)
MTSEVKGKTALVTGASRGIGAATAVKLAELGINVVLNYRSKAPRALEVAAQIEKLGVAVLPVKADITDAAGIAAMFAEAQQRFGGLDYLILNASGGLEKDRGEDYAMLLNHDAQLSLARAAEDLMHAESRIVFVTSHWAHFYHSRPVISEYEPVAKSKRAGEDALRAYAEQRGVSLVVVSGDLIEGTITPRLLQKKSKGLIEARRQEAGALPTVDEFAAAIVQATIDSRLPSGHTIFVGAVE